MNKPQSHLISLDSRSAGLARVCLALAKTDSKAAWQCRHQKNYRADLNRHPLAFLSLTSAMPGWAAPHTIPIAEAAQRLRGLVQPRFIPLAILWRSLPT